MAEPADRWLIIDSLSGLAIVAGATGAPTASARLHGAVEAIARAIGYAPYAQFRDAAAASVQAVRDHLGEAAFAAVWAAGADVPIEQVIAEALALPMAPSVTSGVQRGSLAHDALTPRERDVLRLLVAGRSNPEIASALFISPGTARTHVGHILAKLGVHSRAEAAAYAARHGLVALDPSGLRTPPTPSPSVT